MRVTSYTETIKPHIEKCIIMIKNVHHYEKKTAYRSQKNTSNNECAASNGGLHNGKGTSCT